MRLNLPILCALALSALHAETLPRFPDVDVRRDILYVNDGHARQKLDLFVPKTGEKLPLLVWVHGGAWKGGDKSQNPAIPALGHGCAVAAINYRFSQHALFPAQLEDCKAAIRWLRAHADEHRIDPDRIAVWGGSAGGHLVTLLGTTGDVKEFDVGGNLEASSRVQCVVDCFGPTDFEKFVELDGTAQNDGEDSPIVALLGGPVRDHVELARKANPINYITKDDPPFLVMHGDEDRVVPLSQSELLVEALKKSGVPAQLYVAKGRGHGSLGDEANQQIAAFLREQFKPPSQ